MTLSPVVPSHEAGRRVRGGTPWGLLLACAAAGIALASSTSCTSSGSPFAAAANEPAAGGAAAAGAAGAAGSGGRAGAGVSVGGAGGIAGRSGQGGASAGGGGVGGEVPNVFVEPPGPPELRFLNGIADASAVRLCLVPMVDGVDAPDGIGLLPMDKGLAYGASLPIDLSTLKDGAVHPFVIGGDDAALVGQSCATLLGTPPGNVVVRSLPVVPAGALSSLKSLLLVATGCLTGKGTNDPKSLCGATVSVPDGNASSVLVDLSRVLPQGLLSLQLVHASRGNDAVQLSTLSPTSGQLTRVASNVGYGGVAPRPPFRGPRDALFGLLPGDASLQLDASTSSPLATLSLPATLGESGVSLEEFADGVGFVFVLVGPRFVSTGVGGAGGAVPSPFANPPRLVVLRAPATAL